MTGTSRTGTSWTARLVIALLLVLIGAAAATWALARYQDAAQVLGVAPRPALVADRPVVRPSEPAAQAVVSAPSPMIDAQVADLRSRIERVENAATEAQGSAGRADALVIAFAARRSIDRGVALGYLEPLLVQRFGVQHPQAVSTIVTASRAPVRLTDLAAQYEQLRRPLLAAGPQEGVWSSFKRELGSLIHVHRADQPSTQPQARYERALAALRGGEVDTALAETMRLPGAARAREWTARARQHVAVHRALDELESAALLGSSPTR